MAAVTKMINANITSRIHLLSHLQIFAEQLIAVILSSGCLGWDTESPNIKKLCDFCRHISLVPRAQANSLVK